MNKLNINSQFLDNYLLEAKKYTGAKTKKFLRKKSKSSLVKVRKFIESNIERIIVGSPVELMLLASDFEEIYENLSEKSKNNDFKLLEKIFSYDYFKSNRRSYFNAYKLIEEINQKVCPYCNENYITFQNIGKNKFRRPLDHFLPKSLYPIFSVSIYNLIPSCAHCNSLKSDIDIYLTALVNPYEAGIDELFKFKAYKFASGNVKKEDVQINIKHSTELFFKQCTSEQDKIFSLKERYQKHLDIIAANFNKINYINDMLLPRLHFFDKKNIKNILFISRHDDVERTLDKLEKDMLDDYLKK